MATRALDGTIVAEGTWLYGDLRCRLVVVRRSTWYGTGDHEDDPAVRDDQERETFELVYGSLTDPDAYSAGGGQYASLEEARAAATRTCGTSLRWYNVAAVRPADDPRLRRPVAPRPRGTMADHRTEDAYYLFKNVGLMRATYQVRLLAYFALIEGKELRIEVPRHCRAAPSLDSLIGRFPGLITLTKV